MLVPARSPRTLSPERRISARVPLDVQVRMIVRGRLLDAASVDVSRTGMRVVARRPVAAGDEMRLIFLVDGEIVSARATVRWCTATGPGKFAVGVAFDALDEGAPDMLARLCRV